METLDEKIDRYAVRLDEIDRQMKQLQSRRECVKSIKDRWEEERRKNVLHVAAFGVDAK